MQLREVLLALTASCLLVGSAFADAPTTYPEDYDPSWAQTVANMNSQLESLLSQQVTPLALAQSLISELDDDWGQEGINFDYQFAMVSALHWLPYHDDAIDPVEVAEEVRTGLLDFYSSMPKTSPISTKLDGSALLYYAIAGALRSASEVARPAGDRDASDALVEIAANHSGNHPLDGNPLLGRFLNDPANVSVFEEYYVGVADWYGDSYPLQMDDPPIVIPIHPDAYFACIGDCFGDCDELSWFNRALCGIGCLIQCLPELVEL